MTVIAFLVTCAAVGGFSWLARNGARRLQSSLPLIGKGTRCLESVERLNLTPNHSLHVLRIAGQTVVVAVYPSGLRVVEHLQTDAAQNRLKLHRAGDLP